MSTESSIAAAATSTSTSTATATTASTTSDKTPTPQEKRFRSIFDVPANFFDGCCLLSSSTSSISTSNDKSNSNVSDVETKGEANKEEEQSNSQNGAGAAEFSVPRWTCNTCKAEFECLHDQRLHFKSDIHRINVKLSIAGKDIVNEEDFDEDSFKDCDISSVSGSEDEAEKDSVPRKGLIIDSVRQQKLCFFLETEERVSVWKCLLVNEHESVSFENNKASSIDYGGSMRYLRENEVIERLKFVTHESRDKTHLRIVLLASGGHFAGCVFDGNSVVAHRTFHRYVVRAKAGKKQSSKDGAGRYAHSAGASLRRYNELALKKDVQELLAAWKPYFDASSCIFFHAPSSNRQLFFDGNKAYFSHQHSAVRNVPMSVRRPTLKEARRIYNQLTQVAYEVDEMKIPPETKEVLALSTITITDVSSESIREGSKENMKGKGNKETSVHQKESEEPLASGSESEALGTTTPLHEAAKSGDSHKVLELLEQGLDPCIKDEKGRTPYILANEKEVRDSFRRFMASNLDMWDWRAANVPSALTKEMEESQAAKQAEKEAKRKARAKELKKLRKAKEKKAQAEAVASQNAAALTGNRGVPIPLVKGQSRSSGGSQISKEEEMKRAQTAERERRAAAAERRMAAAAAERRMAAAAAAAGQGSGGASSVPSTGQSASGLTSDVICSRCNASLAGKVPFHRYNYKYCSTSCMHVHREILEDG